MTRKSIMLTIVAVFCVSFVAMAVPAQDRDQLQTQDRLMTCDQFVDADNDGICDNCGCVDADGDGTCDLCPCGDETRTRARTGR